LSGIIVGYTVEASANPLDARVIVASSNSPNSLTTLARTFFVRSQIFLTNNMFDPFITNVYFLDPARVIQSSAKAPVVPVAVGYAQLFTAGAVPPPVVTPTPVPVMTPAEHAAKEYAGWTALYSVPQKTGTIVGYTSPWNGSTEYVILRTNNPTKGVLLASYLNQLLAMSPNPQVNTLRAWITDPWFDPTNENIVLLNPSGIIPQPAAGLARNLHFGWEQEYVQGSIWTPPGSTPSAVTFGAGVHPFVLGPQNHIYQLTANVTGNVTVQEATKYDLACKPPIDLSKFPHKCVKCGYPAYNGFASTECSKGCK
jgi:hypothetical protein